MKDAQALASIEAYARIGKMLYADRQISIANAKTHFGELAACAQSMEDYEDCRETIADVYSTAAALITKLDEALEKPTPDLLGQVAVLRDLLRGLIKIDDNSELISKHYAGRAIAEYESVEAAK